MPKGGRKGHDKLMKYNPKIYVITSIAIFAVYLLISIILDSNFNYITGYWVPAILIANAIFIVPIVMHRKLYDSHRRLLIKKLAILSFTLISLAMIFVYLVLSLRLTTFVSGWGVLAIWIWNIAWLLSFTTTMILVMIATVVYKKITSNKKKISNIAFPIIYNFVFPFYFIILIFLSFFIFMAVTVEVI